MGQKNAIESRYYSGQGIVLVSELDANNNPLGFRNVGNVSALGLGIEVTTIEHKESSTGQRATDKRITTETKGTFNMTVENLDKANLELALRGSASAKTGAAVVDESIVARLGLTVPLANIGIDAGQAFTITSDPSGTTYEEGKNYELNAEAGSITFYTDTEQTANGAATNITDAAALLVSYTYFDYDQVLALNQGIKAYALRFEGLNTADTNKPVVVQVHKIEADPLQELALINDEIGQMAISGSILADTTKDAATESQFFWEKIGAGA